MPLSTPQGLYPAQEKTELFLEGNFARKNTFIQSNGFSMALIDLSLVMHEIKLNNGGRVQF